MGEQARSTIARNRDLPHGESLAELEQTAFGIKRARRWLTQKIDGEICSHGQWHPADRGKHSDIHAHIGKHHQGHPGNGAAGTKRRRPERLTNPAPAMPDRGDCKAVFTTKGLRKFRRKQPTEFFQG